MCKSDSTKDVTKTFSFLECFFFLRACSDEIALLIHYIYAISMHLIHFYPSSMHLRNIVHVLVVCFLFSYNIYSLHNFQGNNFLCIVHLLWCSNFFCTPLGCILEQDSSKAVISLTINTVNINLFLPYKQNVHTVMYMWKGLIICI